MEAFPDLARRVAAEGHLVGHHSFYHARMPLLSDDGFAEDVREAERVDHRGDGQRPAAVGALSVRRRRGSQPTSWIGSRALGYRHIGWDVEVYEWDPGRTADEIAGRAVDGVLAHGDGAILLLHTWPDPVAPALAEIVERLRAEGARFVGVDELDLPEGSDAGRPAAAAGGGADGVSGAARPSSPSTGAIRRSTWPSSRAPARSLRSSTVRRSRTSRCRWTWRWRALPT